jgi:hypothetical protein
MVDVDTFITTLSVIGEDFCPSYPFTQTRHPGPQAALSCSEVVTLALFGQGAQVGSERAFYRYAELHLRAALPALPDRSQGTRLLRQQTELIIAFGRELVRLMDAQNCLDERVDSSGLPTQDAQRRGAGWLPGQADSGWSNRLGW